MRWNKRKAGREIIQSHNQTALVCRLRVRREQGGVSDSVVQSGKQREKNEKIKKCEKRTRLFAVIRSKAEINRRPSRKHSNLWFYTGYKAGSFFSFLFFADFYQVFAIHFIISGKKIETSSFQNNCK